MHRFYESVIPFIEFLSVVFLLSVNDDVKHFELPLCLKMCYINKHTLPYLLMPSTPCSCVSVPVGGLAVGHGERPGSGAGLGAVL